MLVAALGIQLGNWQSGRAEEKSRIAAAMASESAAAPIRLDAGGLSETPPAEFRRVEVTGRFVDAWPLYLDNRPHGSAPGFYVLMPFRIESTGRHVMVARGWTPRHAADRTRLPALATPASNMTLAGVVRDAMPRVMDLGESPPLMPGAIVQNVAIPELQQATGLSLLPFFVQQTSDAPDGLVRDWPVPASGIDKHRGYAFQWYGLSLMAILFYLVTGIRRESR